MAEMVYIHVGDKGGTSCKMVASSDEKYHTEGQHWLRNCMK